ncbi:MAG TPA: hypothetical protein VFQ91_24705 [Bryobacteraceae bacterium]|nr:hypothetical protein [Bryobacteraceae bacterium]
MPTKVTAKNGDCLCGLAVDAGFLNCDPLRAVGENAAFLSRELRDGDEVTIPDLTVEDHSKAVDSKHTFKLKSSPPFHIRFVHGSPTLPYRDDTETTTLHVSNFVTNLGGADGLKPFPTGFGFHDDGHQDPDTFKVEVWDPAAGGSVNVKLETLKPVYTADTGTGKLTPTSFTPFTEANRKHDALVCNQVGASATNTYRSKYMRLVVDENDISDSGLADQLLLTTDVADGLGTGAAGDNDTVEILDQMVRATYEIQRCTGSPKCKVTKTVEIGGTERRRIKLHFYAVRKDPGVDIMPTGVAADDVKKHLRRRTFKWYRRVYAQADMAPKLAALEIIDPPAHNMFCLSHGHGLPVSTATAISLNFKLVTATRNLPVAIAFAGGEVPLAAAGVITTGLPAGFSGDAQLCTLRSGAINPSVDLIITADNGERVRIVDPVLTPGAGLTVDVPRVDPNNVDMADASSDLTIGGGITFDMKRLLRAVPVTDDGMHCIVVGKFNTFGLRGRAFREFHAAGAAFKPPLPFRSATIMAYQANSGFVLDNSDNLPFTSPHESAHVICDMSHTIVGANHDRTELLGASTPPANSMGGTKRLCDGPYLVRMTQRTETTSFEVQVRLVQEILTQSAAKLEAW